MEVEPTIYTGRHTYDMQEWSDTAGTHIILTRNDGRVLQVMGEHFDAAFQAALDEVRATEAQEAGEADG